MGASISGGCADEKPSPKRRKITLGKVMLFAGTVLLLIFMVLAFYDYSTIETNGPVSSRGVSIGWGVILGCFLTFCGAILVEVERTRDN